MMERKENTGIERVLLAMASEDGRMEDTIALAEGWQRALREMSAICVTKEDRAALREFQGLRMVELAVNRFLSATDPVERGYWAKIEAMKAYAERIAVVSENAED